MGVHHLHNLRKDSRNKKKYTILMNKLLGALIEGECVCIQCIYDTLQRVHTIAIVNVFTHSAMQIACNNVE